jgi:hypothetical protein
MHPPATHAIEREGWRLLVADAGLTPELREAVIARSLEAARGALGAPKRRSRHASTWQIRIGSRPDLEIFIKVLDAPRGFAVVKRMLRGSRADHVASITQRLNDSAFLAPPILLHGHALASASEIMVTPRADGDGPLRTLRALRAGPLNRKRAVLHALGAEIARLHRCGFVHGDLTPFNIFFIPAEPPRFVLIDHERTRRAGLLGRRRQMLRNLVQLGRFDLPSVTATDRMRVVAGYVHTLQRRERRMLVRRVNAMLRRRIARDGVAHVENLAIGADSGPGGNSKLGKWGNSNA